MASIFNLSHLSVLWVALAQGLIHALTLIVVALGLNYFLSAMPLWHPFDFMVGCITTLLLAFGVLAFYQGLARYLKLKNLYFVQESLSEYWTYLLNRPFDLRCVQNPNRFMQQIKEYEYALSELLQLRSSVVVTACAAVVLWGFIAYFQSMLALFLLSVYVIISVIKSVFIKTYQAQLVKNLKVQSEQQGFLHEILLQITKLRTANREKPCFQYWRVLLRRSKHLRISLFLAERRILCVNMLAPCVFIVWVLLMPKIRDNPYQLVQWFWCFSQLNSLYEKLAKDAFHLLTLTPRLLYHKKVRSKKNENPTSIRGELKLNQVCLFDQQKPRIHPTNLLIKPGEFIVITGSSGSGKTTLLHLILGLEPRYQGCITIDGLDISSLSVRRHFGVVLQDAALFPGTIFSNIALLSSISLDQAWEFAEQVGLAREIALMPMKMFTYIGDNAGESLSGGQRQRILLARAIARNPRILFLDEATSALDYDTEKKIVEQLRSLKITCIFITHRRSLLRMADRVFEMSQGRLVERV